MKAEKVEIGTKGIKRQLRRYDQYSALVEFIWNGFDAEATTVEIQYESNAVGFIREFTILDNGTGIPRNKLDEKFKPFNHTNKEVDPKNKFSGPSAIHGKNGYGRLTFFRFANTAKWSTVFQDDNSDLRGYSILVDHESLNTYEASDDAISNAKATGTRVDFQDIAFNAFEFDSAAKYLAREFAWFLELHSPFQRRLLINGKPLDYEFLIGDRTESKISIGGHSFDVRYVRWDEKLHDEYSRYYFIGSDQRERAKRHTTLNNKGDGFYHSVYVQSLFFDSFENDYEADDEALSNEGEGQLGLLLSDLNRDETFKELRAKLDEFLRKKRSPFLRKRAQKFIKELETDGAMPEFGNGVWEQHRKEELTSVVREIYQAEPRVFSNLNIQQKQTMVRLFDLVIDKSEKDDVLEVISQVVNLSSQERAALAKVLRTAKLSNITATIKLIQDRYLAVDELQKMLYKRDFGANERDHIQTHIERHFWLFGEEYHLVASAEADFQQALRRYLYLLRGDDKTQYIEHEDKEREMDIFAVRQLRSYGVVDTSNIVLELKHPRVVLGRKHLDQVKDYMDVILQQPEFNAVTYSWDFYLVGNDFDRMIAREIESAKNHGEKHLAMHYDNVKIYVMKWGDVFNTFKARHDFVLEKLKLERELIVTTKTSADAIIADGHNNSAALTPANTPINTSV